MSANTVLIFFWCQQCISRSVMHFETVNVDISLTVLLCAQCVFIGLHHLTAAELD